MHDTIILLQLSSYSSLHAKLLLHIHCTLLQLSMYLSLDVTVLLHTLQNCVQISASKEDEAARVTERSRSDTGISTYACTCIVLSICCRLI
jgi:hypothetical protein